MASAYSRFVTKTFLGTNKNGDMNITFAPRIIGGKPVVNLNSYSFNAQLIRTDKNSPSLGIGDAFCGGTFVSDEWLVTAAHCVEYATPDYVGSYMKTAFPTQEPGKHPCATWHEVERVVLHPDYDSTSVQNDIALLKIKNRIQCESFQAPRLESDDFVSSAVALGWGKLSENGFMASYLQGVTLPVVSDDVCENLWGSTFDRDTMMCAGDSNRDTCHGDSGGPLFSVQYGIPTLIGITSFGYTCAHKTLPGVYTRVQAYSKWITNYIYYGAASSIQSIPSLSLCNITQDMNILNIRSSSIPVQRFKQVYDLFSKGSCTPWSINGQSSQTFLISDSIHATYLNSRACKGLASCSLHYWNVSHSIMERKSLLLDMHIFAPFVKLNFTVHWCGSNLKSEVFSLYDFRCRQHNRTSDVLKDKQTFCDDVSKTCCQSFTETCSIALNWAHQSCPDTLHV